MENKKDITELRYIILDYIDLGKTDEEIQRYIEDNGYSTTDLIKVMREIYTKLL